MTDPGESVTMRLASGARVPAIPLPLFGFRKRCYCGRKFWTLEGYRGHYALVHILNREANFRFCPRTQEKTP